MSDREGNLISTNKELSSANKELSLTIKNLSQQASDANAPKELPLPFRYLLVMYAVAIVTSVGGISQSWDKPDLSLVFLASIRNFVFGLAFLILGVLLNAIWPIFEHFVKL